MNITNYIQFDGDNLDNAKGAGLISTVDRDMDIKVVPFASDNEKAPTHRVYASHCADMTSTPSRSASFATTPISAGSPARTTPPCRRSSNGNPAIKPFTVPGEQPGAHLRKAGEPGKVLIFSIFPATVARNWRFADERSFPPSGSFPGSYREEA